MVALAAWNFFQVRNAYLEANRRWVSRVSNMIVAERLSWLRWMDEFPADHSHLLEMVGESNPQVSGVFLVDTDEHETQRWVNPALNDTLDLDPRLVILELQ